MSVRLLGVVLAGALVLAACGDDDDAGTSGTAASTAATSAADTTTGGTGTTTGTGATTTTGGGGASNAALRVGAVLAPVSLDLTRDSGAGIPQLLLYNVYETLVKIDDDGAFQPLLASKYDVSDDGLTYTFTLQDGVTFHSGKPMTSADVKFSFDRNLNDPAAPSIIKETFSKVASVAAPDPQTVVVTLKERSRNFLYNIAQTSGIVINEAAVPNLKTKEDGTGPFTVSNFQPPNSATLTRYDGYWGDPAAVASAEWRYITDANAMANAVQSGDIDIVTNLAPELFSSRFANSKDFQTVNGLTNGETMVSINNSKAPLDDVRVRQAISYAINKEDVLAAAESGYGKIIGTHASPSDPWFTDIDKYPFDPDKAKQLLADAGVSSLSLTLRLPPTPYAQATGPIVQSQLGDVGINVSIENVEFPRWIEQVFTNADYDLTVISHVEARDVVRYGDPTYYWRYNSPKVQQLLAQADAAPTDDESNDLYDQVLNQIADDAVNDWLFVLPNLQVISPKVKGYPENAYSLSYDLTGITKS